MNKAMNRVVLPLAVVSLLITVAFALFSQRPWQPRNDVLQPIPFSHRVHAGERHIPCQYCHNAARRSADAGIPPVQRCVGCHGDLWQAALKPVTQPLGDQRPVPLSIHWNRVYTLPDFVRFAHQPHIRAGVPCQACHGPVQVMDRIVPYYQIDMGFCLKCHQQRNAPRDCVTCHY